MKKLLVALTAVMLFTAFSFSDKVYAEDMMDKFTKQAIAYSKVERTDEYALDYYKHSAYSEDPAIVAQAKKITEGITNDYEKVQAIFQWATANITYTRTIPSGLKGIEEFKYGVCETFATTTMYLAQAAGFPAKYVSGTLIDSWNDDGTWSGGGHAWTEVYVDGRWMFIDSTGMLFDEPITWWSHTYIGHTYGLKQQDEEAWNGSLYFWDFTENKVLKEVKNFPFNSVVTSTYGFDINDLYLDTKYTKPFTLNTLEVNSQTCAIFVKQPEIYTVTYYIRADNANKSLINYTYVEVKEGSKIKAPKAPTKKGYTFTGWYDDPNPKIAKKWNFKTDKVTSDTWLVARFKKK